MAELELDDIQGIFARGYGSLAAAQFVLLRITEAAKARAWLASLLEADRITSGSVSPDQTAMNLAFTNAGLEALGLNDNIRDGFSEDFLAGMTTPHKRRILGDHGANAPENWIWGGPDNDSVHILLLLYAKSDSTLGVTYQEHIKTFEDSGLALVDALKSLRLPDAKEHFGFRDGISQPFIGQLKPAENQADSVALGEFLLGYPNAYNRLTQRPLVKAENDPYFLLPTDTENSGNRDLGMNGTYLVFRQLEQDVKKFWEFVHKKAASESREKNSTIQLASKMVGRWPSGAPMVKAPDRDEPGMRKMNDFAFHHEDPDGIKCPFGSHIRRTNPRDSLEPRPGTQKSVDFSNRHRILRRGRPYGQPLVPSMRAEDILGSLDTEDNEKRGLHFVCLNANIARQFEFVQHTWSNNPNFNGLYNDPDPLTGDRGAEEEKRDTFTIQAKPVRQRVCGMPEFVRVKGGAYFFLPGIRALRFLASIKQTS